MTTPPAVLLIDDGELGQFRRALTGQGCDFVHLGAGSWVDVADRPRDLLITSWRRAIALPTLLPEGEWDPIWVCTHNQDFLPLRDRMRAMGIQYLVSSQISPEAVQLLLVQLLYQGAERRGARRLPVRPSTPASRRR